METIEALMNKLKKYTHIISIIFVFTIIVIMQGKQNQTQTHVEIQKEASKNITQTEEIGDNTNNTNDTEKTENQITSRHSLIRGRKNENITMEQEETEQITEKEYTKIEDITISKDMDLSIRTGISKEDFKKLISNVKYDTSKFFYDNSDFIYNLCEEYQINEIFFCGLISAESGWSIASNHRRTHNYISLMTKNGLIHYNSVEEGLIAAAKALHNNYLTEGGRFYHGKTLYGVKTNFCPSSSTWVDLVYGRMQQIMRSI